MRNVLIFFVGLTVGALLAWYLANIYANPQAPSTPSDPSASGSNCELNKRTFDQARQMVENHRDLCFAGAPNERNINGSTGRKDAIYVEYEANTIQCFLLDIISHSRTHNLDSCHVRIYYSDYSETRAEPGSEDIDPKFLNRSTILLVGAEKDYSETSVYNEIGLPTPADSSTLVILGGGSGNPTAERRYNHGTLCPPDCGAGMSADMNKGAILAKAVYNGLIPCFPSNVPTAGSVTLPCE